MKRMIVGIIAGLMLGTAGMAGASSSSSTDFHANGIWCKAGGGGVACVAVDGSKYGVGISKQFVMVQNNNTSQVVFQRYH